MDGNLLLADVRQRIKHAQSSGLCRRFLNTNSGRRSAGVSEMVTPWELPSWSESKLTDAQREKYKTTDTGEEASTSFRSLFRVECKRCGATLHERTTDPSWYMDIHDEKRCGGA